MSENMFPEKKSEGISHLSYTIGHSGKAAVIAASILRQKGFENVEDSLGSMETCSAAGCPIE